MLFRELVIWVGGNLMDLHRRNMSGKPQVRVRPVLEHEVENGSLARSSHKFVEEIVGFKNPGALEEFMIILNMLFFWKFGLNYAIHELILALGC